MEIVLPEHPAIVIYPKDAPTYNKTTCSTLVIAALSIIVRSWKPPRCPSTEECIQKLCTFTQWIITQPLKQRLYEILRQMEGTRKYHPE